MSEWLKKAAEAKPEIVPNELAVVGDRIIPLAMPSNISRQAVVTRIRDYTGPYPQHFTHILYFEYCDEAGGDSAISIKRDSSS